MEGVVQMERGSGWLKLTKVNQMLMLRIAKANYKILTKMMPKLQIAKAKIENFDKNEINAEV